MDALYPRLLVRHFDSAVRFWSGVLRDLLGIEPVTVLREPGYAHWEIGGQVLLALCSRESIARTVGTDAFPADAVAQDTSMLVLRVRAIDDATRCLAAHGALVITGPQDRPEWSAGLRTAQVRDPEGNLIELRSR